MLNLKKAIKNKSLKPLYIFNGEEVGLKYLYLDMMSKYLALPIINIDDVEDRRLTSPSSLIKPNKGIFVIRYNQEIIDNKDYWSRLINFNNGVLVLVYNDIDTRKAFYKRFKDNIIEFNKTEPKHLIAYVQRNLPMFTKEDADFLVFVCNYDYGVIQQTISLIKEFSAVSGYNEVISFDILLDSGDIYIRTDSDEKRFCRAIMNGDVDAIRLSKGVDKSKAIPILSLLKAFANNSKGNKKRSEFIANLAFKTICLIKEGLMPIEFAIDFVLLKILNYN